MKKKTIKIGDKVKTKYGNFIIVGISTMIYDKDCEGEPEWKITKKIQEVAIATHYEGVSYQKPNWIRVEEIIS